MRKDRDKMSVSPERHVEPYPKRVSEKIVTIPLSVLFGPHFVFVAYQFLAHEVSIAIKECMRQLPVVGVQGVAMANGASDQQLAEIFNVILVLVNDHFGLWIMRRKQDVVSL